MVPRLILLSLTLLGAGLMVGCGAPEPVEQETPQSTAAAQEAASRWTEEDKKKLSEAMARARSGEEGREVGTANGDSGK